MQVRSDQQKASHGIAKSFPFSLEAGFSDKLKKNNASSNHIKIEDNTIKTRAPLLGTLH